MTEFNDRVRRKVAEMHDEISALRKENDHLIQAIEDLHDVSLEDRLVQLENENAKLREELADARQIMADELEKQISDYRARHIEQAGTITELESENAELRELAALGWEWAHSCCGNSCKMRTEGCGYGIDRECNYEREIADRMRQLGVEVDDAEI